MGSTTINGPELWQSDLPVPQAHFNKYDRGFVGVFAAPELTGATRLAASACSRVGAGLVSVIAQTRQDIYRTCLPADLMVQDQTPDKVDTLLGGSGGMLTVHHNEMLAMQDCRGRIFDADGLPKEERFNQLDANCVLTPHRGEFERIFGPVVRDSESAARRAAQASGAIVVLKSHQTVIATPDGRAVTNQHASAYLAKAGTGDVLAGMITGLIAQTHPDGGSAHSLHPTG